MRNYRFLVVHEDPGALASIGSALGVFDGEVLTAGTADDVIRHADAGNPLDLVVMAARGAGLAGPELVREIRSSRPRLPVLVTVGQGEEALGLECVRLGAETTLRWPLDPAGFASLVKRSLRVGALESRFNGLHYYQNCPFRPIDVVADANLLEQALAWTAGSGRPAPILIRGGHGTEKPLLAKAFHFGSARKDGKFVTHLGECAAADGGTLFIEEVADLDLQQQSALVGLIRDGACRADNQTVKVSVQVIAGTGKDLSAAEAAGRFLPELRQAFEGRAIRVPPLAERRQQIPALAERLHLRLADEEGRVPQRLTEACKSRLIAYDWPGNMGELRSVIERAMLLAGDGDIDAGHLPGEIADGPDKLTPSGEIIPFVEREQAILRHALEVTGGRIPEAARRLAIGRATLYRKVKKYNLR